MGFTGSAGTTGPAGNIGFTGSAGVTGVQGNVGFTGSQGLIGFTGSTGAGTTQTLSWDESNTSLSISDGNSVTLTGISGNYSNSNVQAYLDTHGYSNVDLDTQAISIVGNIISITGNASTVDLTSALASVANSYGDANVATFLSTNNYSNTDIQPASISADSTDGTALALTGGDATGLNSTGGDVDIDAGSGALQPGYVNIGENSTGVNIGGTSTTINVTGPLTLNNQLIIEDGVSEKFSSLTGATGVVTHDCDNGHIFYHSSISANFTANFTNLGLSTNYGTTLTLILDQGATARIPSAVQISGSAQTINWQGGSEPTGTNNGVDAVSFTIFRVSGNYVVLGQLVDFT